MRIAIVSDIHGNRTAQAAVLADLQQASPDLIVQGGDLASGSHDAEVRIQEVNTERICRCTRDIGIPAHVARRVPSAHAE